MTVLKKVRLKNLLEVCNARMSAGRFFRTTGLAYENARSPSLVRTRGT